MYTHTIKKGNSIPSGEWQKVGDSKKLLKHLQTAKRKRTEE